METWRVLYELGTEFLNIIDLNVQRRRVLASKTKQFQTTNLTTR